MELLDLNDDIFLRILPFLNLTDLLAVSKTCTRLKELCLCTKPLWSSLTFNLGKDTHANERTVRLTEDEKEILEISSDKVQNIHISVDFSEANEFDQQSLTKLEIESQKWNLKKFCFDALKMDKLYTDLPRRQFLKMLRSAIKIALCYLDSNNTSNASLETLSLSVHGWSFDTYCPRNSLAKKLRSSNYCESLKSLTLDCFFSCQLRDMMPWIWPTNELYGMNSCYNEVIARFKNLRTLEINSAYLTNSLIEALSQPDHVSLQNMTIVLDLFHGDYITSWPQLVNSSPSLKVTVEAIYDVRCGYFCRALPDCVPVVSWKFYSLPQVMPYAHNDLKDMFNLLCLYKQTLQSVAVQNGLQMLYHPALWEMVTQCSELQTLYLRGRIHYNLILKMASLQRQWLKLSVLENDIHFPGSWEGSRQKNITRLCVEVSEKLGYQWKPESEDTYTTIFNRPVLDLS